jgi:2,4-dienoyl-CoA reductase-like NADH-dependent reductase (Old Yellow Enzyme family)
MKISEKLELPCGAVIKNRFLKSAMTEGLASENACANQSHVNLYDRWAKGGSGILVTGNVQVDHRYIERPGNVVIEGEQTNEQISSLANWAKSGTQQNTHLWMQISHAGRQTPYTINKSSVAPSPKRLSKLLGILKFSEPNELKHSEILDIIDRFVHTAEIAKQTGFTGVQLHSAHGYLLSEFLSPDINQRTDEWGGSIQNRSRLLISIIEGIREKVGNAFPISVKLNSSDFQKGGFSHEESIEVSKILNETSLDLLEISGGTYEGFAALDLQLASPNQSRIIKPARSTIAREAYFLKYAEEMKKHIQIPLAVTGGFRSTRGMNEALESRACDIIGLGRPLCPEPDIVNELLSGEKESATLYENHVSFGPGILGLNSPINYIKANNKATQVFWCYRQILKMAEGKDVDPKMSLLKATINHFIDDAKGSKAYRNYWKI